MSFNDYGNATPRTILCQLLNFSGAIRRILTVIAVVFCVLAINRCASTHITEPYLEKRVQNQAESIDNHHTIDADLSAERIGEGGFFYIIDSTGRCIMHPNVVVLGAFFGELPSVKEVLLHDRGIVRENADGMRRVIVYRRLYDGSILCLSIDTKELE